jgi:hypothetical protein
MGLDQYAYCAARAGQHNEYYEAEGKFVNGEWTVPGYAKPREIAYWRKHPNLQGWMEDLWARQGNSGTFNGIELELTWQDLDQLEKDIRSGSVASLQTIGFFFGDPSDDYYREHDLEFIKRARAELFSGLKVFYNSSW